MSVAIVADRIAAAQDAPWALDIRVWSDLLSTAPVDLQDGRAWLQSNGQVGAGVVATLANTKATVAENTLSIRLSQLDLLNLLAGPIYIEVQWQDASGNVGRVDFSGVRLLAGLSSGFSNPQALGVAYDVQFAAETGESSVLGLVGGPMGPPRTSAELEVGAAVQGLLDVTNVDDALAALARPMPTALETELLASTGGDIVTLQDLLVLLCRRAGLLSAGGGDWNPNL